VLTWSERIWEKWTAATAAATAAAAIAIAQQLLQQSKQLLHPRATSIEQLETTRATIRAARDNTRNQIKFKDANCNLHTNACAPDEQHHHKLQHK